jgi:predicted lipoprotein with Yx(FWY)xxD motif
MEASARETLRDDRLDSDSRKDRGKSMKSKLVLGALVALGALAGVAQGQDAPTVTVMESEQFGSYLTDGEGRTLYLFVNEEMEAGEERMTEGVRANAAPCAGGCLQAWPPLTGEATAGEGVDDELLYTADVGGTMQAVYNGWPLYYFANDAEPGQINGQGRGRAPTIWYILSPEGNAIEAEN